MVENHQASGSGDGPSAPRPRRRREQSEASAFLSKTYAMIDALPPHIGGWSAGGDSMVILDADTFASEIIPQYFKHNNFRSFVRQLNFYGFRKLRADSSSAGAANSSSRWEFKHCNFRRGKPELLVQIRRAEHYDYAAPDAAAQRQRQTELERDIVDLRARVGDMQTAIDNLTTVTRRLADALDARDDSSNKRPRRAPAPASRAYAAPAAAVPATLDTLDRAAEGQRLDSFDALGLESMPSFSELEGKPLKRLRQDHPDAPVEENRANDDAAPEQNGNLEGEPLSRRLSTFETSRLESLIRTLDDDNIPIP
ncbi:hypothetical protein CTAYLR_008297 [Chrysophaeum taylorii]|uniref:HSF-type DNA-binding domain-containing protein n=1 Tax=Chrysophaeum taylorii TaxID=2483200 RepID=A0AAD7U8X1_9STRA|nr:hypothetical protein CTAYLR_008297 [Chrysophaeum taylorii]